MPAKEALKREGARDGCYYINYTWEAVYNQYLMERLRKEVLSKKEEN